MSYLSIVTIATAVLSMWVSRHTSEEMVGVMATTMAALLLILGIILSPWQIQLGGLVVLMWDRITQKPA
ncbi:hypothetical protein [[Phormidium] sp. ETS-05]|uniref:hypothetical protein n=1 Tax=[Phormidium] sp. ETS-05 TaxID=222819 RepID=UPI0018EF00AA|nr:hypothetical protein [[Phormidium] sp. ETS-05]